MKHDQYFGGIEAGGTKFNCLVARSPEDVLDQIRIPTTSPTETLQCVTDFFSPFVKAGRIVRLGVGSFGPCDLAPGSSTYGFITSTPKPSWQNTDVVGQLQAALGVEVLFDTDVNAAALIESFFRDMAQPAAAITDFDKLPVPFRAIATDLETGAAVVLDDGSLAQAMRASMSVPGAIAPVEIDGRLLVDGGLADNLPIDNARRLCGDVVIAVNISTPPLRRDQITSVRSVTAQVINFIGIQTVKDQLKSLTPQDVLIAPDLGGISASNFDRSRDAIRIGEEATRALAPQLRRYSVQPEQYAALRAQQLAEAKSAD